MTAERRAYDASLIEVAEFDAGVRMRPGMYFGVGLKTPQLPTRVLCAVAGHALHPERVTDAHTLRSTIEITGDLDFTVIMDQQHDWGPSGLPRSGYFGSLLGPEWWLPSAAAALSGQVTVQMWCAGRGLSQEHDGIRPRTAPQEFDPPPGSGTMVSFALDPAYFGRGHALPTDLEGFELHHPSCPPPGPGHVLIRDLRGDRAGRQVCYR
jgi:hypothetical protein